MELFQYAFFQYALLGSLFTAIACGIVGTYIVSRRLVFISGGITHASFGGLGLGFYTGMNPIVSAMLFACLLYTSPSPRDTERSRMPSSA